MVRKAVADMKSFLASIKGYRKEPSAYLGCPKLPGYKKPGGMCSMDFSNQTCRILREEGRCFLTFAKTKHRLALGHALPPEWVFRQVMARPRYDRKNPIHPGHPF